jgi:hypothetical protein
MIFELKKKVGQRDGNYTIHQQGTAMCLKIDGKPLIVRGRNEARAVLAGIGHFTAVITYKMRRGPDTENPFFLQGH